MRAHPHVIPLILTRRSRLPAVFDVMQVLLDALTRGGNSGQALLIAFRSVSALVMGFAQAELAGPLALKTGETANATIARFRALPADRYPHLIEIANAAECSAPEAEFHAALYLLLEGISAGD